MTQISDEDLVRAARRLPTVAPSADQVARARDAMLLRAARTPQRGPRSSAPPRAWLAAAVALLCIFAGTAWLMRAPMSEAQAPRWATVSTSGAAVFHHMPGSQGQTERVHLSDGRIRLDVIELAPAQAFIVEAGEAEIVARGGILEISVMQGRLQAVQVISGRAMVQRAGHTQLILGEGETWTLDVGGPVASASGPTPRPVTPEPATPAAATAVLPTAAPGPRPASTPPRSAPASRPRAQRSGASAAESPPPTSETVSEHPGGVAFRRGWLLLMGGSPKEAAAAFAQAKADGSPVAEDAHYWYGVALLRCGRSMEAEQGLEVYLRAYPRGIRADEAALLLGRLRWDRGDTEGAQPWLQRAANSKDATLRKHALRLLSAR